MDISQDLKLDKKAACETRWSKQAGSDDQQAWLVKNLRRDQLTPCPNAHFSWLAYRNQGESFSQILADSYMISILFFKGRMSRETRRHQSPRLSRNNRGTMNWVLYAIKYIYDMWTHQLLSSITEIGKRKACKDPFIYTPSCPACLSPVCGTTTRRRRFMIVHLHVNMIKISERSWARLLVPVKVPRRGKFRMQSSEL